MALHYESPRYTTDIDFSTPERFTEDVEREALDLITQALPSMGDVLGYNVDCRLQGYKAKPSRTGTWVSLNMRVGYALKGTPAHRRLVAGQSPYSLSIDFSFRERIPASEEVVIGEDGHLRVYGLSTLVAEKLRALLQQPLRNRNRRQDVYDLYYLLEQRPALAFAPWQQDVLADLRIKCEDRAVPLSRDAFDNPEIAERAQRDYDTLYAEVEGDLPEFDAAFERVRAFFRALPW